MLFQGQYVTLPDSTPNYDVTADGQKFLMLKSTVQPAAQQINVVVNWFEELNQKVPAGENNGARRWQQTRPARNHLREVRRKVPIGKYLQSRLILQISNKNQHCEVV